MLNILHMVTTQAHMSLIVSTLQMTVAVTRPFNLSLNYYMPGILESAHMYSSI